MCQRTADRTNARYAIDASSTHGKFGGICRHMALVLVISVLSLVAIMQPEDSADATICLGICAIAMLRLARREWSRCLSIEMLTVPLFIWIWDVCAKRNAILVNMSGLAWRLFLEKSTLGMYIDELRRIDTLNASVPSSCLRKMID